jgi:predicted aspartyl protease
MNPRIPKGVGPIQVEIELTNWEDLVRVKYDMLEAGQVRRVRMQGVVGIGATHLVLPTLIAKQLGLPVAEGMIVHCADRRKRLRKMVENVRVDLLGRHGVFNAIVEPKGVDVLIGANVLEDLDLLVDCRTQTLQPNDPSGITAEIE